jgi:phosphate-selective porin
MKRSRIMMALLVLGVVSGNVSAETTEERLAYLEKEVLDLKRQKSSTGPLSEVDLGGYGELHYNNLSGSGGASDSETVDFHRFVIYMGYEFSDRIRFSSELELEHSLSGDEEPGEVELEQAYIDFDLNANHTFRGGLFLLPVGIINETHEPTTFYGVERNSVEKNILPTTWWEAGAGMHGGLTEDLLYSVYIHSGLMTSTNSSYAVRSGRQKVAKANASDLAATIALKWSIPGVTVGGSVQYQSDITQGSDPDAGDALLGELHADLHKGPLGLRTLYSEWALDGEGPDSMGSDKQYGWYVEPSFRPIDSFGIFARYSEWNNKAGSEGIDGEEAQYDVGVNWWPHEQVVVKADYQWQDNENGREQNGFNLGLGYDF